MLKLFPYGHLEREDLLAVSKPFHDLAHQLVEARAGRPGAHCQLAQIARGQGRRGPRGRHPGDRMNALRRAEESAQADIRSALRRRRRLAPG